MTRNQTMRASYARQQAATGAPRVAVRLPVRRVDWTLAYGLTVGGMAFGFAAAVALALWF